MRKKRRIILKLGDKEKYELAWRKCYLKLPHWKKRELDEGKGNDRVGNQLAKEVVSLAESEGFVENIINEI